MRHDHAGDAAFAQHMQHVLAHLVAQAAVEAGERLVHQQHARARRDRARERDALLLAAREHVRIERRRSCASPTRSSASRASRSASALRQRLQPEHHIGEIGQMREQREVLEHQADAAPLRRLEAASPATSRSLIRMRPALGRSTPAASRSSVVLPQPDGPSSETISPGAMSRRKIRHRLDVAP